VARRRSIPPRRTWRDVHDQSIGAAQPAPPLPGNDEHHRQRALGGSGPDESGEELADRRGGGAVDGGGYSLAPTWDEYFARFNWLHETGVLWTKPSEPCFYPALGIPLLMSVPLGAHEGARSRPGTWAGLETLITLIEMSDQPRARVVWEGRSREAPPYPDLCAK
jgi:hypothetical protein